MPFEFLTVEVADRIAKVTVTRPDKLNALNAASSRIWTASSPPSAPIGWSAPSS